MIGLTTKIVEPHAAWDTMLKISMSGVQSLQGRQVFEKGF